MAAIITTTIIANSILLGAGLAMDAFSVSVANAISVPDMKRPKMCLTAGVYAGFQFIMPLIGWFCVHTAAESFKAFNMFIPWIALGLLVFIGGKMIIENLHAKSVETKAMNLGAMTLLVQGVATSIDALSVGFTTADYDLPTALFTSVVIAAVTFVLCMIGLMIGKLIGRRWAERAQIIGGIILIAIGIKIVVTHFL